MYDESYAETLLALSTGTTLKGVIMTKLIYYGIDEDKRKDVLLNTADAFNIATKEVKDEELGELLGYLAGLEGYEASGKGGDPVHEELLVFVDFPSELLQKFLLAMRDKGEVFPHKAAMTETTKDWTFERLVRHIKDENAVVTAWAEMLPLVKENLQRQKKEPTDARKAALEWSQNLRLKGDDLTEEDVREAIRRLKEQL